MKRPAQEYQTGKFSWLPVARSAEIAASCPVPGAPISNARWIASHAG
jgi:hypothetical protein